MFLALFQNAVNVMYAARHPFSCTEGQLPPGMGCGGELPYGKVGDVRHLAKGYNI